MKALLLAAGFGTRLRPLTNEIPKCLVPINGRPLLDYWLEMLVNAGIKNILINTHYLPQKVNDFVQSSEYSSFITLVYEKELLGTGGTLLKNKAFFGNDPIMLIHADNLSKFSITDYMQHHDERPAGTDITMLTFETDSPQTCGIVELDGMGVVKAFHEKVANPPGNLANGAVYILENSVIDFLEKKGRTEIDFSNDVLPFYINRIYTFENKVYHRDIGNIESYNKGNSEFALLK